MLRRALPGTHPGFARVIKSYKHDGVYRKGTSFMHVVNCEFENEVMVEVFPVVLEGRRLQQFICRLYASELQTIRETRQNTSSARSWLRQTHAAVFGYETQAIQAPS